MLNFTNGNMALRMDSGYNIVSIRHLSVLCKSVFYAAKGFITSTENKNSE
jgi:hypothetical protein